jgi:general stress protein 26
MQSPHSLEAIQKLAALIKDIRFAMLTTITREGHLHSRPMATQASEFTGDLWFFTDAHCPKTEEINEHRQVNVSYAKPNNQLYVSVSGWAEIVQDQERARTLWRAPLKAWFPRGLEDPNLALIRVSVEDAEYWESPGNGVIRIVGFAKGMLTGDPYIYKGKENKKLKISA